MKLRHIAFCLLVTNSLTAHSEAEYPTAAEFVAMSEILVEHCALIDAKDAERYLSLRGVFNTMFAKRNYASFIGKPEYVARREALEKEVARAPTADVLELCKSTLKIHAVPQGVMFYE